MFLLGKRPLCWRAVMKQAVPLHATAEGSLQCASQYVFTFLLW